MVTNTALMELKIMGMKPFGIRVASVRGAIPVMRPTAIRITVGSASVPMILVSRIAMVIGVAVRSKTIAGSVIINGGTIANRIVSVFGMAQRKLMSVAYVRAITAPV